MPDVLFDLAVLVVATLTLAAAKWAIAARLLRMGRTRRGYGKDTPGD